MVLLAPLGVARKPTRAEHDSGLRANGARAVGRAHRGADDDAIFLDQARDGRVKANGDLEVAHDPHEAGGVGATEANELLAGERALRGAANDLRGAAEPLQRGPRAGHEPHVVGLERHGHAALLGARHLEPCSQALGVEGLCLDGAAAVHAAGAVRVVVGVVRAQGPVEAERAEQVEDRGDGLEVGAAALGAACGAHVADADVHVFEGLLERVLLAQLGHVRVVGEPQAAAADGCGAAPFVGALHDEHREALILCRDRRAHRGRAGAADQQVDLLVKLWHVCSSQLYRTTLSGC